MIGKLERSRILVKVVWNSIYLRNDAAKRADYVVEQLVNLGGAYLKFLQIIMLNNPNILGTKSRTIRSIYDRVDPEPIDVASLLNKELYSSVARISHVESEPFACGSFGQVYRARLDDQTKIIIKIIRPSVVQNIKFDLKILRWATNILSMFNKSAYDVKGIFKEFATITKAELDYKEEANYADTLHQKYLNHSNIVIPKTYLELSTRHIIVQDYIDGVSATEIINDRDEINPSDNVKARTGSDLKKQLIIFGQETLAAMLTDGYSHGDPHPGNILFLPDNKVGLIDFGIKSRSPADKKAFFELIKQYQKIYSGNFDFEGYTMALIGLFVSDLKVAITSLDKYNDGLVSKNVLDAIQTAALKIYKGSPGEIANLIEQSKYSTIFNSVINENNRFGFRINIEEPEFIRATHLYIGLVDAVGLKKEVFRDVYTNIVIEFNQVDFPPSHKNVSPETAVEYVAGWLGDIADKDIFLFNIISSKLNKGVLNV